MTAPASWRSVRARRVEERVERVAGRVLDRDGRAASRGRSLSTSGAVVCSTGSALLIVGVFSDAGSACSPVAGAAACIIMTAGCASSSAGGASHGKRTTRSALHFGVAYGTASAATITSSARVVFPKRGCSLSPTSRPAARRIGRDRAIRPGTFSRRRRSIHRDCASQTERSRTGSRARPGRSRSGVPMFGIHCVSARTRAAIRVCALLGPLAAASACRSGDASDLKEGTGTPPVPARPLPSSTAPEGAMGNLYGAEGAMAPTADPNGPMVDLNSLASRSSRRSPCRPARTWGRAAAAPARARRARRRRIVAATIRSSRASSTAPRSRRRPCRCGPAHGQRGPLRHRRGIRSRRRRHGAGVATAGSARRRTGDARLARDACGDDDRGDDHRDRGRRLRDDRPARRTEARTHRPRRGAARPSAPSPWRPSWPGSIRTRATRRRIAPAARRSPRSTPRSRADRSPRRTRTSSATSARGTRRRSRGPAPVRSPSRSTPRAPRSVRRAGP